ncbi:MAG: alpha/beta fold hydrolase [Bacteroidota bacterium]|nr:alpha/beta fold hydrolase [Bacteroidota bacterium]
MKTIAKIIFVSVVIIGIGFGQTRNDVTVQTFDSVKLDATYYVPKPPKPKDGFPAIIFVHGFGMDKYETMPSAQLYANMGYLTFTFSVRGHGDSEGLSKIMSTLERKDLETIINYVRSISGVDSNLVGITGGSQGGLHGLWAAADQLPIRAITADEIGARWASDILVNGCYRSTLMYLLFANTVQYDAVRDTLFDFLLNDDYSAFYNMFVGGRDIELTDLQNVIIPLMLFGKWQDHYSRANATMDNYLLYPTQSVAAKLYLGTGGHFSDEIPDEWSFQFDWLTRWFGEFLKGEQTGILLEPNITYAYSSLPMDTNGYFTWTHQAIDSWTPPNAVPVKFYLRADGNLANSPPTDSNQSMILLNDYRDPTYTFYWAFWDDFQGEWFDSSFRQQSLIFQTSPLVNDVDWVGVPRMNLYVDSDTSKFQINVQVYEIDPSNKKYFVNRINYTGRNNQPGIWDTIDVEGYAHAHQFKSGNSIRIEISNLDITNRLVMGNRPFVVPVFERSQTLIAMNASYPSYIELPILSLPVDNSLTHRTNNPKEFYLSQNYPNPFNPVTTFFFSIKNSGFVSLKIFDVIGREVQTLVNEFKPAGEYNISWDGSRFSSGIYLYELSTKKHRDVKKLLLVK